MGTKIIYQIDDHGKVIGCWKLPENYENPIIQFIKELKRQKIEEIRIDMEKYGITLDDLKEVNQCQALTRSVILK